MPVKLEPIVGPAQRTAEWYAMRKSVFGASEAAALCGLSDYKTPRHIYEERVNPLNTEPKENEAMRNGRYFEPAILGIYGEVVEHAVEHPLPMLIHPELLYLAASLDGRRDDGRPVEAKWSMSRAVAEQLGEEGSDWTPTTWLMQTQAQMDVVAEEVADVAVMLFGRLRIYTIHRNDALIEQIHAAAAEMLERIENRDPPEHTWTHPGTLALVKRLNGDVEPGKCVDLPAEITAVQEEYRELSQQRKAIEKRMDELDARRRAALGDAEIGFLQGDPAVLKRVAIADSIVSQKDVDELSKNVGEIKRRGYVRIYDQVPKNRR